MQMPSRKYGGILGGPFVGGACPVPKIPLIQHGPDLRGQVTLQFQSGTLSRDGGLNFKEDTA